MARAVPHAALDLQFELQRDVEGHGRTLVRPRSGPSLRIARAHGRAAQNLALGARLRLGLVALALLTFAGCTTAPPRNIDDLCQIFAEQPDWRRSAERAEARWGTRVPVAMAFVRHESSFRADARPPRTRLLGLIPWTRPSSAYGYAQATDEAWEDYLGDTGRWFVSRSDLGDSLDFIGWYNDRSVRRLKLRPDDAVNLYLAYHEGHGGYAAGTWREKAWLRRYAGAVADRARKYAADLARCRGD